MAEPSLRSKALIALVVAMALTIWAASALADGWLVGAEDERERAERLEQYLGGFSAAMWEVGERYERVEQALADANWALAGYHWEKIQGAIDGGMMKRPGRAASAEALFLGEPWQNLADALDAGDPARIGPAFATARDACVACHIAEDVEYMNDQPMFRRALPLAAD